MLRRFWTRSKHPVEYVSSSDSEVERDGGMSESEQGVPELEGKPGDRVAKGHAELEALLGSGLSQSTLKEYKVLMIIKNPFYFLF